MSCEVHCVIDRCPLRFYGPQLCTMSLFAHSYSTSVLCALMCTGGLLPIPVFFRDKQFLKQLPPVLCPQFFSMRSLTGHTYFPCVSMWWEQNYAFTIVTTIVMYMHRRFTKCIRVRGWPSELQQAEQLLAKEHIHVSVIHCPQCTMYAQVMCPTSFGIFSAYYSCLFCAGPYTLLGIVYVQLVHYTSTLQTAGCVTAIESHRVS